MRPAALFGLVHRFVGSAQGSICRIAGASRNSNTDTGADMCAVAVPELNRLTDFCDHAVRDLLCLGGSLDSDQNGHKFITALSPDEVAATYRVLQYPRDMA